MGKVLILSGKSSLAISVVFKAICIFSLFIVSSGAFADNVSKTIDVKKAFTAALFCENEFVDARNKQTFDQLTSAGVNTKIDEDGDPIDLEYQFNTSLEIAGVPISKVRYIGDSGAMFFAYASGDMQAFAKLHHAEPIKKPLKIDVGFGKGLFYRYSKKPTKNDPYPNVFFVGREKNMKSTEFIFGCQEYDY